MSSNIPFFISKYINKVDAKGRSSIPALFRSVLEAEKDESQQLAVIIYPSVINNCIEACSLKSFVQISSMIDEMDPFSEEADAFAACVLGEATEVTIDSDGRIILPSAFRKKYKISGNAVFVGKGKRFEIWNSKDFEEYLSVARENAKKNRSKLTKGGC